MQSKIQVFTNEKFGSVRTTVIDSKPWFVGKDVPMALGYSNPQKAIGDHVDDKDRTVNDSFTVNGIPVMWATIPHRLEATRQRFDTLYAKPKEVL